MRIDKTSVGYMSEARAMRARYIHGLLNNGWNAVFSAFRSAVHLLKRTDITTSRNPGQLAKR